MSAAAVVCLMWFLRGWVCARVCVSASCLHGEQMAARVALHTLFISVQLSFLSVCAICGVAPTLPHNTFSSGIISLRLFFFLLLLALTVE